MVWAGQCPCIAQMHTVVSAQSLCTDSVKQTSLTVPLTAMVIKSKIPSARYGPPPLPLFIAVHTNLLLQKLIRAPSLHTMPVRFAYKTTGLREIFPGFQYQTRGSLLLSPALHSLCALRIYDAKVRSANGFNGAPTIEISLRRPLPARY